MDINKFYEILVNNSQYTTKAVLLTKENKHDILNALFSLNYRWDVKFIQISDLWVPKLNDIYLILKSNEFLTINNRTSMKLSYTFEKPQHTKILTFDEAL